jgi:hypothetical protein
MAAWCWRRRRPVSTPIPKPAIASAATSRSAIFAALSVEGVQNVILREPAQDIVISRQQAPYCTGMSVAYAGVGE